MTFRITWFSERCLSMAEGWNEMSLKVPWKPNHPVMWRWDWADHGSRICRSFNRYEHTGFGAELTWKDAARIASDWVMSWWKPSLEISGVSGRWGNGLLGPKAANLVCQKETEEVIEGQKEWSSSKLQKERLKGRILEGWQNDLLLPCPMEAQGLHAAKNGYCPLTQRSVHIKNLAGKNLITIP